MVLLNLSYGAENSFPRDNFQMSNAHYSSYFFQLPSCASSAGEVQAECSFSYYAMRWKSTDKFDKNVG